MNETLEVIRTCLEEIVSNIEAAIPDDEPFGIAHRNWSFPCLTKSELIEEAQDIIELIEAQGGEDLGEHEARLKDYVRRLKYLQNHTTSQLWNNPAQAVPAYLMTLQGLRKALAPVLDSAEQVAIQLKGLKKRMRAMESILNDIEPQGAELCTMVENIKQAYEAAEQLPTDLDSLSEAKKKIESMAEGVARHQNYVVQAKEHVVKFEKQLEQYEAEAQNILKNCKSAYSAATSVGLAAAFSERSNALSKSMWFWIGGLVLALGAGIYFATARLGSLERSFGDPNVPASIIVLNFFLLQSGLHGCQRNR